MVEVVVVGSLLPLVCPGNTPDLRHSPHLLRPAREVVSLVLSLPPASLKTPVTVPPKHSYLAGGSEWNGTHSSRLRPLDVPAAVHGVLGYKERNGPWVRHG